MDKEPAVQPMLQFHLQVEHAPLVTPGLDFFDVWRIFRRNAKHYHSEDIFGITRVS